MCTAGGAIGEAPMGLRNCEPVNAMIGSPASRTLTRAILAGSNFARISRFSRPTVEDSTSHELRRREKEVHCCKAAPCAVDAAGISAPDTRRGVEGSKHGTSVIAYICDRASGSRGEPNCQSIAERPIDEAVGTLITEKMTPAAIELALEIRREIEARYEEADRLRHRAIERAQIEVDLAQRRYMLVDPANRLVADTLKREWNDKLRALARAQEERERGRQEDLCVLDEEIQRRLVALTTDFKTLWLDPGVPNRERKRLLACIIEDATLIKSPEDGTTKVHIRFKGGKTETLTTLNPKSAAQQVKTQPRLVDLVDKLLDDHIYSEIADLLNERGLRPGGSARRGQANARFTALRVAYLVHRYGLRLRYERLRDRGMLTKEEAAASLGIHESTLNRWVEHGIVVRHAYNGYAYLYEPFGPNPPVKHSSRWDQLTDRAAAIQTAKGPKSSQQAERGVV